MTRPLDAFTAALTLALCAVWGFNQVVVKAALPEIGPIWQTGARSAIGVACVVVYAIVTKRRIFRLDGTEAAGALAGLLFTVEFIALYESLRWTTAARATVFVYAAPFFVALGAALVLKAEKPRPIQWLGLILAFFGVAVGLIGRAPGGGWVGDMLALVRRRRLGRDDHCHQGDAAAEASIRSRCCSIRSSQRRCIAPVAACCARRACARASFGGDGRGPRYGRASRWSG